LRQQTSDNVKAAILGSSSARTFADIGKSVTDDHGTFGNETPPISCARDCRLQRQHEPDLLLLINPEFLLVLWREALCSILAGAPRVPGARY
jgi:hypothetical protein